MDKKIELISKKAVTDLLSTMLQDVKDFELNDDARIAEEYVLERVKLLVISMETLAVFTTKEVEL